MWYNISVLGKTMRNKKRKNRKRRKKMVQENITAKATETTLEGKALERAIADLLRKSGIPAHLRGYDFLVQAIKLAYGNKEYIYNITKRLYPKLAKDNETTASRVERTMRHAIEVAFDRGDVEFLNENFTYHNMKGKATNSEFIADAVVYLKNYY